MSNLPEHNVIVFKGQNKILNISILGVLGGEDLSGDTLTFNVYEFGNEVPILTKSTDQASEIEIVATSEILVKFVPADTSGLDAKRYYYNLWHTDVLGDVVPALTGYFNISLAAPNLINTIRLILDKGAELGIRSIPDEIIPPADVKTVYVTRRRVRDILGVWLLSDTSHGLINYYTGGTFDSVSGEVSLATFLPEAINDVRVAYTWEAGIDDQAIEHHLDTAKIWVEGFSGTEFIYNGAVTSEEKQAERAALSLVMILCILTINGANVAQMGYNFRVQEFEVQTKLWGEGMIAEALFNQYMNDLNRWLRVLGEDIRVATTQNTRLTDRYSLSTELSYSQSGRSVTFNTLEGTE